MRGRRRRRPLPPHAANGRAMRPQRKRRFPKVARSRGPHTAAGRRRRGGRPGSHTHTHLRQEDVRIRGCCWLGEWRERGNEGGGDSSQVPLSVEMGRYLQMQYP